MTLTFDLKIKRAHPWLMGSTYMKFHDHRLITESVIAQKPFTINHASWPWPLDLKINKAPPWFIGSKCTKFHNHRLITEQVIVRKPFKNNHTPWPWPFDLKINRAHPWLMGSKCMKFHYYISKGILGFHYYISKGKLRVRKPFVDARLPTAHQIRAEFCNSANNSVMWNWEENSYCSRIRVKRLHL